MNATRVRFLAFGGVLLRAGFPIGLPRGRKDMANKLSRALGDSPILEVVIGLGLPAGFLVALDAAWIRLGQSVGLELVSKLVWAAAAIVTPIVFWRLWHRRLPGTASPRRWAAIAFLTGICSLAWFYFAYTVLVNIHLAMGGSL